MNCHRNKFFVCLLLAFGLHLSATCAQEGILDGLGDAAAENEAPARPNQANFPDFFGGQRQLSPEEQQQLQDQIQKLNTDAKAKEAADRARLVKRLAANDAVTLDEEQLGAMDMVALQAFADAVQPDRVADYSAAGGVILFPNRDKEFTPATPPAVLLAEAGE